MQKKYSMIYLILPPKAEEGWIKPDQCQVNSTLLELTYHIETLHAVMAHVPLSVFPLLGSSVYLFKKNNMKNDEDVRL